MSRKPDDEMVLYGGGKGRDQQRQTQPTGPQSGPLRVRLRREKGKTSALCQTKQYRSPLFSINFNGLCFHRHDFLKFSTNFKVKQYCVLVTQSCLTL